MGCVFVRTSTNKGQIPHEKGPQALGNLLATLSLQGVEVHELGEVVRDGQDILVATGCLFQWPDQVHPHHVPWLNDSDWLQLRSHCR